MCLILLWKIIRGFGELCDQRKHKLAIIFDVPKKWDVWGSGCIIRLFIIFVLYGDEWSVSCPILLTCGKDSPSTQLVGLHFWSSCHNEENKYFSCGKWSTNCSACSLVTVCTELHSLLFESVTSQNNEYYSLLKIQEKVAGSFNSLT